jgi:hypothetical protein
LTVGRCRAAGFDGEDAWMTDTHDASADEAEAPIYVEVDSRGSVVSAWDSDELRDRSGTKVVTAAGDMVARGVDLARRCATQFSEGLSDLQSISRPSSFELALGITLDSEVGAFVAKAKAGAQIQITMTWDLDDK